MKRLILLLLVSAASVVQATTYYINFSGGLDANDGLSPGKAWKTLSKWNSALAGDTLLFKRGETWTGGLTIKKSYLTFAAYGTGPLPVIQQTDSSLIPIYIDSQTHLTFRNMKIAAHYAPAIYFGTWISGADGEGSSYILIDSCTILGPVQVYGAHNTVQNCEVDGTTNNGTPSGDRSGIFAHHAPSHHNTFATNIIHRFGRSGIHIMQHTHDDQIINNTVYDINGPTPNQDGQAIDIDSYGDVSWRNLVRGNIVYNSESGISLENCFESVVETNTVYGISDSHVAGGNGIGSILYSTGKIGGEQNQYGANGDLRGMNTYNIIRQNVIHDIVGMGIAVWDTGALTIDKNTLYNNVGGDIYVTASAR